MPAQREPIAIVGMTAIHPGSSDAQGFWADILNGRDLITPVPSHYWLIEDYFDPNPAAEDKTYAKRGAFLSRLPFDAREFGIPPAALPATDSAQLLALIGAQRVLRDAAAGRAEHVSRERTSVILGVAGATASALSTAGRLQRPLWVKGLRESGLPEDEVQAACARIAANFTPLQENTFPGLLSNVVAGRIANRFDLGGSNFVVDAACAGSLAAVSVAINELHLDQADMVITGGVDAMNDVLMYMCFSKTPALSPTGDCRPFSDNADGTMIGEGLSMFALRRLSDAQRDSDRIYAVIRGLGSSSDGRAKSVYAPRPKGQALALRRAYDAAGFGPETVELVEAHGTGTPAGDVAEFEALRKVYEESGRGDAQWCALGSVKSQIGHTKSAAGAAALFKAAMALHQKVLPPTIKVDRLNPKLDVPSSPFYINTSARPWIGNSSYPRRAAVSSFGFGGTNFHAVLEEYGGDPHPESAFTSLDELITISADSPQLLARKCLEMARSLDAGLPLRNAAFESQRTFVPAANSRIAFIGSSAAQLTERLNAAALRLPNSAGAWSDPSGVYFRDGGGHGKIAFLFAGQGSQYPGMGKDLAICFADAREVWEMTDAVLADESPRFHDIAFGLPVFSDEDRQTQAQRLTATENAQPAMAAAAMAHLIVLRNLGIHPDFAAGHSFGELAALHCAGVFTEKDLVRIARRRGALMKNAGAGGAMTAVSHSAEALEELIAAGGDDRVVVANYNAPAQTVLAGSVDAIESFERDLHARHIAFRRLPVSNAFHSPLMAAAVKPFAKYLSDIALSSPSIPVVSNVGAAQYPDSPTALHEMLSQHLASPVRFAQQIEMLYKQGVRTFVELGAGSVLTGLTDACLRDRDHAAIPIDRKGQHGLTSFWHALGQLAVAGIEIDFPALWSSFAPVPEPKPVSQAASVFLIDGANYAKPYPPPGGAGALPKPNHTPVTPRPLETSTVAPAPVMLAVQPVAETVSTTSFQSEIHQQIAAAQKASHDAILESLRLTLQSFAALSGREGELPPPQLAVTPPQLSVTPPQLAVSPPQLAVTPPPVRSEVPATTMPPAPTYAATPLDEVIPAIPQQPQRLELDIARVLLAIVSDKTGYPVEVLDLDADLESGLGIDSIKRVEIFSALQEQVPGLPELKPESMAALRTLSQIVAFVDGTPKAPPDAEQRTVREPVSPSTAIDISATLLRIVSDKTGYPVEVLDLDADLESGLGIDSIKRVEIFSALQEQVPGLPELKPETMASLRTLAQISNFVDGQALPLPDAKPSHPAVEKHVAATAVHQYLEVRSSPAPGLPMPKIFSCGPIAVTQGPEGLAEVLAGRLTAFGVNAQAVSGITPEFPAVIFLGALRNFESIEDAIGVNRECFRTAQALANNSGEEKLMVTIQATGGDFGLSGSNPTAAWTAGVAALLKTAASEWPDASTKAIDIAASGGDHAQIADAIVSELLYGGPQIEVGLLADGSRVIPVAVHRSVANSLPVPADSVIVVTGGGRGVTAACILELARETEHCKLALFGRTRLSTEPACCREAKDEPALKKSLACQAVAEGNSVNLIALQAEAAHILAVRQIRATLASLQAAGCEAMYITTDLRDASALANGLSEVRAKWGKITGFIHGSGVIADKLIAEKTPAQFDRVFDTKVVGLRSLLSATDQDALDLMCLFSSVSARYGNAGQCDYAMANEILNKVADTERLRRGASCTVRSLNWGPWAGGMVSPALATHFESRGVELLPLAAGSRSFIREMYSPRQDSAEVVLTPKGAPLLAANPRVQTGFDLLVNSRTDPFLNGHRIRTIPVVPAALVMEWFHRAAAALYPEVPVDSTEDLRVLSGITVPDFEGRGTLLRLLCEPMEGVPGKLGCQLLSAGGKMHYSAILSASGDAGASPVWQEPVSVNGSNNGQNFYPSKLFHGPEFQVIRHLREMGDEGASAILNGYQAIGWSPGISWKTDVGGVDGALQVIRLWTTEQLGGSSLPTGIGRSVNYASSPTSGPIHCVVRCRAVGKLRTVSNVVLSSLDGRPLAELRDVEMHITSEAD